MRQLVVVAALVAVTTQADGQGPSSDRRPRIGIALGGGSARGLAHVGVIRWFEEHHVPIDLVAGTSMGGLVGGAYASGMSAGELTQLLRGTDWDEMFGSSPFRYKTVRRKQDARAYPSRLEFGFRRGLIPPLALNNGQQVDFLLARITGAYVPLASFDELPTPFRCVAVDLVSAQPIVLDRGVLADAMRATMSLPGVFPPIQLGEYVLVDGGAMNNVPADVVRAMGADVVIAVPVGSMKDTRTVDYSLFAIPDQTMEATMRANTRRAMQGADIVINPASTGFGSLDWRRSDALEADGYRAADAMKDKLLPLAIDDAAWAAYQASRRERRRVRPATPRFVSIVGATPADERRMARALRAHVGRPLDVATLETELERFAGFDRYETVGWQLVNVNGQVGLRIRARPKIYAPPFFMVGLTIENTTSNAFSVLLAGRYLTYDVAGAGSELRLDVALGSRPNAAAELLRPIAGGPFFVAGTALAARQQLDFVNDDVIVAQYDERRALVGADVGVDVGRVDEIRLGASAGALRTRLRAGDPRLPELSGGETRARLRWLHDGQDSPVVPSTGARAIGTVSHIFTSPDGPGTFVTDRSNSDLTQAQLETSIVRSFRRIDRAFVVVGGGATLSGKPLPTEQFQLGRPLHLGAYDPGELRGDNYGVLTIGYLHGVTRLPDFIGGPVFVGGWLENGAAFDDIDSATLRTDVSVGAVLNTLATPLLVAWSVGFNGNRRLSLGIGRLF